MPTDGFTWLRFVPHTRVADYESVGWELSDDLSTCHHGQHAVIMRWAGEGYPRAPVNAWSDPQG